MSVGCDQDEGIDGDVKPCDLDPEELEHYVALRRQYDYLGIDDLCKIPGFSGALRRARLRSPRETFTAERQVAMLHESI